MSGIIGGAGSKSGVIGTTELDFETGLWDPYIGSTGDAFTTSSRGQNGWYTKIGDTVMVWGEPWIASPSGGTGDVIITGFPFPANANSVTSSIGFVRVDLETKPYYFVISSGATQITPWYSRSGTTSLTVGAAALNNNTSPSILFAMTYKTNS
jgi:hypothetical protein